MKGVVVYFSQTGNTKKIAQAIHRGMKQVIKESDIFTIKQITPQELSKYDLIGLGAPIWSSAEPPNIRKFIATIDNLKGKHVFPFATHGTMPSGFMQSVVPALKKKGLIVIGWHDWYGGCIWQALPKPYYTDGHPDEIDLKEADDFGKQMAENSRRIYAGETQLIPRLPLKREWDAFYAESPYKGSKELMTVSALTLKNRRINMEKCTECGICVANCPADAIDFSLNPPGFKSSCLGCHFCEQVCPTGALEVDWDPITKIHDKYIKILLSKRLDNAEAAGRFRRLVPVEKIGWDTHWYQITKHPRYKIDKS